MNRRKLLCALAGLVLGSSMMAAAQEKGDWRPVSSTAQSITGEVAFSEDKISIDETGFPIAQIRALQPSEVSAVFESESGTGGHGNLYRVSISAANKFLNRNSLCGGENTEWMATYVAGRTLHLALFSGSKMPVFTPDAIANSTDLCGTFTYTR